MSKVYSLFAPHLQISPFLMRIGVFDLTVTFTNYLVQLFRFFRLHSTTHTHTHTLAYNFVLISQYKFHIKFAYFLYILIYKCMYVCMCIYYWKLYLCIQ